MKKLVWGEDPLFSGPKQWFRNSLIIKHALKYKKHGKLLDFGCGSGEFLVRISNYGFQCIGIDPSSPAIKFLKKRLSENIINNVTAIVGNENFLFKPNGKFDLIISGETLEHIKNDEKVVGGFYKSLKKGGICIITVPAHQERWTEVDKHAGHYRRYKKKGLKSLFKNEGFVILDVFYWGFPLGYLWEKFVLHPLFINKIRYQSKENVKT